MTALVEGQVGRVVVHRTSRTLGLAVIRLPQAGSMKLCVEEGATGDLIVSSLDGAGWRACAEAVAPELAILWASS